MADIRVGYHTITWGMDGFEQALDEIAALGFKGFETFAAVVDTYGDKVSEFQDMIGQRGLELVTVYGGGPMNEAHRMDEMIARNVGFAKFLAAHGADRLGAWRRFARAGRAFKRRSPQPGALHE